MEYLKKRCPYCAELIQKQAIKCRYCGSHFFENPQLLSSNLDKNKKSISHLFLIITFVIFIYLSITNPSKKEFIYFFTQKITKEFNNKLNSENVIVDLLVKNFSEIILDNLVEHSNFLIFSTYKIDLNLLRQFGQNINDYKFVGIAGKIIPINLKNTTEKNNNTNQSIDSMLRNIQNLHEDCDDQEKCNK